MEKPGELRGESIGALFSRLIDRARDVLRAEVTYYRETATAKVTGLVKPAVLGFVALMFVQASLTVLVVTIGIVLGRWLGAAAGLFAAVAAGLLIAALLGWIAMRLATGKK
ncbi:hypothetical protein PQ455_18540 [Sphingomonas naphthae]|uniref:Phage holin family protein n=1 Tax=Sphingomonas naphthae TaxID=1813468 RepID=A0ABY7TK90_9SPHN|nr:hypothetical protein [Sphingomonas naphthae]WCT73579.1 hypothetical protein PQ455_18540 [Sphingomonas naphthae]